MRTLLISLLFCITILPASYAQTLHAIIFANTKSPGDPNRPNDKGIGPFVEMDFEKMRLEMTEIASSIGYSIKEYYYYGSQERFSRTCLLNVLNRLSCNNKDIVFFYYSGHGIRAVNEKSDYPDMVLKVPYGPASSSQLYSLYEVYKTIMGKRPRLTVVIGDLCNSTDSKYMKDYSLGKSATVKTISSCDIYKNLFLNVRGGIIAASSKPGQVSLCCSHKDDTPAGGAFTTALLAELQACVRQNNIVSWTELFNNAQSLTQEITQGKQTPVYSEQDLRKADSPTEIPVPQPPTSDDPQTTMQDNLAQSMSNIANCALKNIERIKPIAYTLSSYFDSPQSRIQVVGRDCKTIVNTTTASSYLNYLSIATNMERVVVLDEKKTQNGKIVYLKVHEIHKGEQ